MEPGIQASLLPQPAGGRGGVISHPCGRLESGEGAVVVSGAGGLEDADEAMWASSGGSRFSLEAAGRRCGPRLESAVQPGGECQSTNTEIHYKEGLLYLNECKMW